MKVAIYARESSDNQRKASIADRLRIFREFAARTYDELLCHAAL